MVKLFSQLLAYLGSPQEQKSEIVALVVVYCMFLSFALVVLAVILMVA
jgi:hypothetical protein